MTIYRKCGIGAWSKSLRVSLAVLLLAGLLAGCAPKSPATEMVLEPHAVKSLPVDYSMYTDADSAISPDGKYMLMVKDIPEKQVLSVFPLLAGEDEEITLFTSPRTYYPDGSYSELYSVGWTPDNKAVFVTSGLHPGDAHKDVRGIALNAIDVATKTIEEIVFVPLEAGYIKSAEMLFGGSKVFLHVTGGLWAIDIPGKSAEVIKDGLPGYDGLFAPYMAPDGSAYLYNLYEDGDQGMGIYRLDVVTGEQKPFRLRGENADFFPRWAPDSKHIAFYSVPKLPDIDVGGYDAYDYYRGEDGPLSISPAVTVVDAQGTAVKTISVEGKILGNVLWSSDSQKIVFIAGPPQPTSNYPHRFTWDSVWTVSATESDAPVKIWEINPPVVSDSGWITPVAFDPLGKGVFFQVTGNEGVTAIWYAGSGKSGLQTEADQPVKVLEGFWVHYPALPQFGDSFAVVMSTAGETSSLWLMNSERVEKVDEWPEANSMVIAYNKDTLVVSESRFGADSTLTVRSMFTEKVVGEAK